MISDEQQLDRVDEGVAQPESGISALKQTFRRFLRNRGATAGLVVLIGLILTAIFAPYLAPYEPFAVNPQERLQPPSSSHLLGTDPLGRDLLSMLIFGSRISLQVGVIAVSIGLVLGTILGLVAGYMEGRVDHIIMRFMDVLLAFPGILLALVIIAVLGTGLVNMMIAIGISSIPTYARLVRGDTLSVKQNEYVIAAHAQGASMIRILFYHILPNVAAPIIVMGTLGVAGAILACAGLSFIGLGPSPPSAEWGSILALSRAYIRTAWWLVSFPGAAITLTVLSINMLGDGLRDTLDPQLKI